MRKSRSNKALWVLSFALLLSGTIFVRTAHSAGKSASASAPEVCTGASGPHVLERTAARQWSRLGPPDDGFDGVRHLRRVRWCGSVGREFDRSYPNDQSGRMVLPQGSQQREQCPAQRKDRSRKQTLDSSTQSPAATLIEPGTGRRRLRRPSSRGDRRLLVVSADLPTRELAARDPPSFGRPAHWLDWIAERGGGDLCHCDSLRWFAWRR